MLLLSPMACRSTLYLLVQVWDPSVHSCPATPHTASTVRIYLTFELYYHLWVVAFYRYLLLSHAPYYLSRITQWCGVYEKGRFKPDGAWIYLSTVNAISQMVALHSLIYFYMGTRKLLGPIRPVGKFLSIKAIVFAIFW